jgi:hypothetical protein
MYDWCETPAPGEQLLVLRTGDLIEKLRQDGGGWAWGNNLTTGLTGWLPEKYWGPDQPKAAGTYIH